MLKETKNVETNKYELIITVDSEKFEQAVEKAYRKNIKKMNVQGFRKGKAPRKMVESLYGVGVFYEDAVNDLYPDAVNEAVKESGLTLVDRPEVEITEVSKENGVELKAICTTKPEVELDNYKGIKVTKSVKAVTDEDIDAELKSMQERNGRIITVEDRAAKDGDNVIIDFEGFVDDVAFEGGKGNDFNLGLGSGQFIPGFEDQIMGKNTGDEFDVNVTFPEDYQAEELKGKDAVFKVALKEIKSRELPELDDEFAKDVSEFDTLAEMKEDIKKKLTEKNEKQAENEVENQMIETLIGNMTAEIPQVMIENRIDESIREQEYQMKSQGLDLETYLKYTGMTLEDFRKNFEEAAGKQVRVRLALEKVVELENIEPTADDMEAEYVKMSGMYDMEVDKIKSLIPESELKLDVSVGKAIDFIKESADITVE